MIQLKDYQARVLDTLETFFRECARDGSPRNAFLAAQRRNGISPVDYIPVLSPGLSEDMPYICLRVPTGGGKTLLACHAVGLAMRDYQRAEQAVVLWLVPSNAILDQTAEALRDNLHPYRRALEMACGAVEVVTIEEALRLSRAAVDGQTMVIVATIQSFRVEDTTGRKAYGQNGSFSEHLLNVPPSRLADLLPGPDGKPLPSLVNMLRLRRPIVIVDEAHNARTDLSFSTLGQLMPSCIVEFTATPARKANPSNVLHTVSAAELNAANMVKLPLRVITRHPSQRDLLLADAVTLRRDLEARAVAEAQETGEYLRPILLLQAERVDDCEPLRERLAAEFGLDRESIRISTGKQGDLPGGPELLSSKCPVRCVITVQKLREGWDCPFAYVLCSLRETRSATAIEQIVGRILRMPRAERKRHPDLNCSYAFSVSPSIQEVLAELQEALESNGFTRAEAERIIVPVPQGVMPLGAQPRTVRLPEADAAAMVAQSARLGGKIRFDAGDQSLTIFVPLDEEEAGLLMDCVEPPEARKRLAEAVELVRESERAFGGSGTTRAPSPYERQMDFIIPLLSIREDEQYLEFESTFLLEHPWKLGGKDATLPASYNPLRRPAAKTAELDVGLSGEVRIGRIAEADGASDFVAALHQQVLQLGGPCDWTLERLVAWLDRRIDHRDIPMGESAVFLGRVLRGLMAQFGLQDVSMLALDRFRLKDQIEERIRQHRQAERKQAFQRYLLPDSPLHVGDFAAINLKTMAYEPSHVYTGRFEFRKHYYGPRPGELEERTSSGGFTEEFQCAQFLEHLPEVECWVRNLPRKASSFRLQTSTDWFYPDFVCRLVDGRILVVELKGRHLYSGDDAEEKRLVGEVWASRSRGRCLFAMPEGRDGLDGLRALIAKQSPGER